MMRWRKYLLVIALVFATGALAGTLISTLGFQKWYDPPVLLFPEAGEVAEMRASIRRTEFGRDQEVPEFVVPAEHVPQILRCLGRAEYDPGTRKLPAEWELGQLLIRSKSGGEQRIHFYSMGKNPSLLTANGVDYFWASSERYLVAKEDISDGGFLIVFEIVKALKAARPTN